MNVETLHHNCQNHIHNHMTAFFQEMDLQFFVSKTDAPFLEKRRSPMFMERLLVLYQLSLIGYLTVNCTRCFECTGAIQ